MAGLRLIPALFLLAFPMGCGVRSLAAPGADQPSSQEHAMRETRYSASGHDITPLPRAEAERLARRLGPEAYAVTMDAGTEKPFCGLLTDHEEAGTYLCAVCGLPLFRDDAKFHSGSGWPSFFQPADPAHVGERTDRSHGMVRTEVTCARCGAHLGHVFPDGPPPTGLRYCMNSVALDFVAEGQDLPARSLPVATREAYFAGGCFWGVEDVFAQVPGVLDAESGYAGGRRANPTYEQVCTGATGHAETVKVVYDPTRVSYEELVRVFFKNHDPTTPNRQGPDVGTQYRSAVFTTDPAEADVVQRVMGELEAARTWGGHPPVTEVQPLDTFWPAEAYHQDYFERRGIERTCHL